MNSPTRYFARTDDLIVQELGDELLIYDKRTDVAHSLSRVAAHVWRGSGSGASSDTLSAELSSEGVADADRAVEAALAELADKDLLHPASAASALSRRDALRKMAGISMAAVATPLVVSTSVATAASTLSPNSCKKENEACSPSASTTSTCCDTAVGSSTALVCGGTGTCVKCTSSGQKPGGADCTGNNKYLCCSGACRTGQNADKTLCA